jgi:hypothetical protein
MAPNPTQTILCQDAQGDVIKVLRIPDQKGDRYFYIDSHQTSRLLILQADGSFLEAINSRQFWPVAMESSNIVFPRKG